MIESGDRVALTYDHDHRGRVVRAGTEQSVVRWDGAREDLVHANEHLMRLVPRAVSRRRVGGPGRRREP